MIDSFIENNGALCNLNTVSLFLTEHRSATLAWPNGDIIHRRKQTVSHDEALSLTFHLRTGETSMLREL